MRSRATRRCSRKFRDSGRTVNGKGSTLSGQLLQLRTDRAGAWASSVTLIPAPTWNHRTSAGRQSRSRSAALPPVSEWANAHDLGVVGDGEADDTAALQRAIDSHRVVYLPLGAYKVSDTIHLRKDSVLIALHPALTQIVLADGTPDYQGVGAPKAVVQSAEGGDAIVSGVGLYTGGVNVRAVALLWSAGENSLVDDVKFELARDMSPAQRNALQQIQFQPLGRAGPGAALGWPIPQPVGDEWRWRHVQWDLEPGHLRQRRPLCVGYHARRATCTRSRSSIMCATRSC